MKLTDYSIVKQDGKSLCPICCKPFSPHGLPSHFHRTHNPDYKRPSSTKPIWNKGLKSETDIRVANIARKVSKTLTGKPGHSPSPEVRKITSERMKKAHAEGKAWNIGQSRWNNQPSYPEKFFTKVIENEFSDKKFKREYPFGKFSLDFAWPHLKRVIEIDGEQHERFQEYKDRDARKDKALTNAGWKILRVKWKEMYKNTKAQIAMCREFIDIPVDAQGVRGDC